MGFYEEFAEKYDTLISWENRSRRESKFFKTLFTKYNVKRVLDCACGTGQHVVMFNQMGFTTIGSDLSPAMIRKAKLNAKKYGAEAVFKVVDFRNLPNSYDEKFDAIVCLGNSLPHLFDGRDLTKAINGMHKLLSKNGILIIEQRNYDMLVGRKKRFFPVSISSDEAFFYALDYFPKKVVFNVIDMEIKTGKFNVYTNDYNPLKKSHVSKLLHNSGFKNLRFFGDYSCKNFDMENDDFLIIVCEKV